MKPGDHGFLAMICSKFIIGAMVLCGIVLSNTGADAKRVGNVIRVGIWDGYKYIDNNTGKFSHCIMGAEFKSGITVFFSINRGYQISVGFYNPTWELKPNTQYPVRLSVDRSISQNTNATANSKHTIRIVLRNRNAWYAAFRMGRRMRLDAAKERFQFYLKGTYIALPRILDCVDQAMVTEKRKGQTNPFAQTSENPFSTGSDRRTTERPTERRTNPGPKQQDGGEIANRRKKVIEPEKVHKVEPGKVQRKSDAEFTTRDMKRILSRAGLENVRVLNSKERSKLDGRAHQAWIGNQYLGFLLFTKHGKSATLESMSSSYVSRITGRCKGAFVSGAREPVKLEKIQYRRVSAKCKRASDTKLYYITFIFKKPGMGITIMLIADGNAFEQAESADEKIRKFFIRVYSK